MKFILIVCNNSYNNMKLLLIIFFSAFIGQESFSQKAVLKFENDSSLTHLINNVTEFKVFKTNELQIMVLVVSNPSGSANIAETDEVSSKVYIGVSQYDERPKQMVYSINQLIAPKDFSITVINNKDIRLKFNYNGTLKPLNTEIKITHVGVTKIK